MRRPKPCKWCGCQCQGACDLFREATAALHNLKNKRTWAAVLNDWRFRLMAVDEELIKPDPETEHARTCIMSGCGRCRIYYAKAEVQFGAEMKRAEQRGVRGAK